MLRTVVTSAQRLLAEISQHRTPDRVAMGIAIGTSFGLVPMDNLVSVALLLAILFLPIHQLSAALAVVIVSSLSPMLWPIPDAIGRWFFSMSWARSFVASLQGMPLMPWFRLNNTVVVGGVLFGIATWMPQFFVLRWMARRTESQLAKWSVDAIADDALSYRKAIAAATRFKSITQAAAHPIQAPAPVLEPKTVRLAEVVPLDTAVRDLPAVPPVLAQVASETHATSTEVHSIEAAAIEATAIESTPTHTSEVAETVLRETIIEVVRIRPSKPHFSSSIEPKQDVMVVEQNLSSVSESAMTSPVIPASHPGTATSNSVKLVFDPVHQPLVGPKSSNSLRYLMRYLTSSQGSHHESETRS